MATITSPDKPAARAPAPRNTASRFGWKVSLPGLLVFALLGGVFLVGHQTGWKLPRRSELFGSAAAPSADWCTEHLVPESQCVECRAELLPKHKEFGFCKIHGVAECVECHPELAQVSGEPKLPAYDTAQALALLPRGENNSRNTLHQRRLQFATAASAEKSGIAVDVVGEQAMTDAITCNGELQFDPTRVAHLSTRAGGTVAYVFKMVGDRVAPGEVLALVDVAQVGQAKSDLLRSIVSRQLASANLARLESAGDGVAGKMLTEAKADAQKAEVEFISARQALVNLGLEVPEDFEDTEARRIANELRFLGIPDEALSSLPPGTKSANLYAVRAPYDGVIVATDAVAGEVVSAADVLFTVADPRRLWLTLNVKQEDARFVRPGLPIDFRTDSGTKPVQGTISWVSPAIDERTRTLPARVTIDNADGTLRDKTFGTAQIILRREPKAIVVPRTAVQSTGDASFVFVRDRSYLNDGAPKVFHVRQVRIGAQDTNHVELLAGVLPGEVVATQGSAALLAQLLRGNLGEGCACHEN